MGKKHDENIENNPELTAPLNADSMETPAIVAESDPPRAAWDSKIQYFFMVISYAVGLGNVWRFPYLTQKHGGGAFLIPYFVMLFVEGMPLLYLELAIGQKLRQGSMGVWNEIHPLMGGVGIASAVTSFMVALYYNAIIMWCFYYLFHSFQSPLPWSSCPSITTAPNVSVIVPECKIGGSTSYFWYRNALDISSGIDDADGVKWKMLLCLIFSWIVVYCCICKGIKSSGKVVYFTAIFPYVVLIIFFGRGITLRGSTDGLLHMFTPRMESLKDPQCWLDAATQIFYSFGLAFGGLIAFSSYNPKKNNCERDAIIVSLCNWFTAIFACTVIFSILGFKATLMYENCISQNIELLLEISPYNLEYNETTLTQSVYLEQFADNIANITNTTEKLRHCSLQDDLNKGAEGTGLAFIIFTQAINEFGPSAPFWSIVFFLMLLSLGLGSEFGTIEGVSTSLHDLQLYPWMKKKWLLSAVLCGTSCVTGILFVLGSGSYWVALFDTFAGSFPLILVALAETIGVAYVYGLNRFCTDIEFMIGHRPNIYWRIVWKVVAPLLIITLLISTLISKFSKPLTYKPYDINNGELAVDEKPYPWYASTVCAFLVLSSILWMPAIAILRRFGCLSYNVAKATRADTQGVTSSTMKFIRSNATIEDNDSGHNSDEGAGHDEILYVGKSSGQEILQEFKARDSHV
ncbi:LOW QUALITY PROTEIN: sodium- and chloride-dependent transporter XTRP3-like [Haliotis rubra]|uniref:LOW QUALITY PROTEIN: sodium- and chloride-dependent transporter XTRP3-like n=1 Tax=Haliotis rubra TaxID=36100 RepID=UPI001EE4FEF0|nr:LOW QUALITY PROTEIN: sodium- and chloride-dependent transporter XTRP3-like [Haliotis rubra]